jgi:V/A-type H+-transporting ATPase subunit I
MDMRPSAARWFEVVVPSEDADDAMESLARRGAVQFEASGEQGASRELESLGPPVARYRILAADYARYWPEAVFERRCCSRPVVPSARAAVRTIERWRAMERKRLDELDFLHEELADLDAWEQVLDALHTAEPNLRALSRAGPALRAFCLILSRPQGKVPPPMPRIEGIIEREVRVDHDRIVLGLVTTKGFDQLREYARASDGRCLRLPDWFEGDPGLSRAALETRRSAAAREVVRLERALRASAQEEGVHRAAGVLERIDWFRRNAQNIRCEGGYCWISGWTNEMDANAMNLALREVGVRGAVSLMDPPGGASSPSVTRHPAWLEPFEVFSQAVGVPGLAEADPTTWVALLVPLLFGYMCGDVGHGVVILVGGLLLRPQTRLWPLLVFAGVSSMVFGFAYGDVFGYEHLIDPLWVRPLEEPFIILVTPLAAGALVLSLGILLHVVESCWEGEGVSKGMADAGQLLVYWGIILFFLEPWLGWMVALGVIVCLTNRLVVKRSLAAVLSGVGHLVQSTLELLLNTVSFARVGAFALAHAALESAVVAMADSVATAAAAAFIAVVGNLVVIAVEGMVVSIQTTRLVLFEFFMRFFEGRGRPFQPAARPPSASD